MQCMRVTCRALQGGCELSDGPRGAPRSLMQPIGSASCCFQSFSSDDGSGGGRAQQSAKQLVFKAPAMEASHGERSRQLAPRIRAAGMVVPVHISATA